MYEYTYLAYLSNEIFFFLIWLYFLLVVHIGSETEACLMHQGGWEVGISVLCVLKLGIYIFYLHSILQIRGSWRKHTLHIKHYWIVTVMELFQNWRILLRNIRTLIRKQSNKSLKSKDLISSRIAAPFVWIETNTSWETCFCVQSHVEEQLYRPLF